MYSKIRKKKVFKYSKVNYDFFDLLVVNKNFGIGTVKEGEKTLGYKDHFAIFIFAVKGDMNVNYPFVFLNDEEELCLYTISNDKNHFSEAIGIDVSTCDDNDIE